MTAPATNERTRTAYLGPEASFSHQAAIEALPKTETVPLPSFGAILQALQDNQSRPEGYDYAVLPVENSTNGSVVQALDLLAKCGLDPNTSRYTDLEVVDEHYLEVHHCLFVSRAWAEHRLDQEALSYIQDHNGVLESSDRDQILKQLNIKTLYSHAQVWGQCNNILSSLLPPGHVERVDMSSTSAAAAFVAGLHKTQPSPTNGQHGIKEEKQRPLPASGDQDSACAAAISSLLAGQKHSAELICIARNIEDEPGANTTRFLVLRNRLRQPTTIHHGLNHQSSSTTQNKSLLAFTISHHVPGSLALALAVFARCGFNLSAIQSRPKPKSGGATGASVTKNGGPVDMNWKYVFFVECLHSRDDSEPDEGSQKLKTLQEELKAVTETLVLLGSWRDRLSM